MERLAYDVVAGLPQPQRISLAVYPQEIVFVPSDGIVQLPSVLDIGVRVKDEGAGALPAFPCPGEPSYPVADHILIVPQGIPREHDADRAMLAVEADFIPIDAAPEKVIVI